jgi:DNA-binding HxlR family transcriptional regulator
MQDNYQNNDAHSCEVAAVFIRGALLLQEKWVLMIVFRLLAGPVGFNELMRRGSVNTTTLTQRLNLLERAGVLVKTIHSTMPPRTSYELTEAGLALRPILESITDWSDKYLPVSAESPGCPGVDAAEQCE